MNLNYAIFRYAINDLAQIGSHNKRDKKSYNFKIELSKNNIELVPLAEKYVKVFKMLEENN